MSEVMGNNTTMENMLRAGNMEHSHVTPFNFLMSGKWVKRSYNNSFTSSSYNCKFDVKLETECYSKLKSHNSNVKFV